MCNNHYSDTSVTVIKTLMDALIDISVIADMAHKHATSETEYQQPFTGRVVGVHQPPHCRQDHRRGTQLVVV